MMNHNVQRAIIAEILFMKNLIGHSPIYVSVSWAETLIGQPTQKIWIFQMMQMRTLEPVPATRFNFNQALRRAGKLGGEIAMMTKSRTGDLT
jgi:hypothetical protein